MSYEMTTVEAASAANANVVELSEEEQAELLGGTAITARPPSFHEGGDP